MTQLQKRPVWMIYCRSEHNPAWNVSIDTYKDAPDFLRMRYSPTIEPIDETGILRCIHEGTWCWFEMRDALTELIEQ